MKSLVYRHDTCRYLVSQFTCRLWPRMWSVRIAPLKLCAAQMPVTSRPGWTTLQVLLAGVCGSDLQMLKGLDSLYLAPEATYPFVPGHELVGRVEQSMSAECGGVRKHVEAGERVAVWPVLGCTSRGYEDRCGACQDGWDGLCQRRGGSWPGRAISIGFCRETGGGWSEYCLAHVSQLWTLPASVSDADAVLLDPAATALACLLRSGGPTPGRTLVIGGGPVGLLCGYLHRMLPLPGDCETLVRYDYQRCWASQRGMLASVVRSEEDFRTWSADRLIDSAKEPGYGRIFRGNFDRVIVTVASLAAIHWSLRAVRPGGTLILAAAPLRLDKLDPTPIWYRELTLRGVLGYGPVPWASQWRHPYDILIPKLADGTLSFRSLVTHTFALDQYIAAFRSMVRRQQTGAIKIVFRPKASNEVEGDSP